ncbi:M3 family oligoendopeptidase [Falsibacillus albus]|uniref:M3 family oligoendopeptidase n=1 Tax=Falsibacillus albus TaxID=2478915 RepID=A0A3L7JU49_9BACI|nr:M3 family oligoendopeptidase [Falsibacillus albus]RLQ94256.1 M3 family oligoendopeptidase [Falsibacillus albus]
MNQLRTIFDSLTYEHDYHKLIEEFDNAATFDQQNGVFMKLNDLRFSFETALNYARLQHFRNMQDEYYSSEYQKFSQFETTYSKLTGVFYRSLLKAKFRDELENLYGKQLFSLAKIKQNSYSEDIEEELQKENRLIADYQSLLGKSVIQYDNQTFSLSSITPYLSSSDRNTRRKAHLAKTAFFMEHENELDDILDELVITRNQIAEKLGMTSFIQLGYNRMNRTGHTPEDLKQYRKQVARHGIPFVAKLRDKQAKRIGVSKLKYFDENCLFPEGAPAPKGSHKDILSTFKMMFDELGPETKDFFHELTSKNNMDLAFREGKWGGNFATFVGEDKSPFLFTNFHGISNDIRVFTHEAGHAFQFFMSRHWNIPEYLLPYDSAEVFSFAMERIAWPWMNQFFGEETEKYQLAHLTTAFTYMPLASAVDEFEHFLYEQPQVSTSDRKKMWRDLEQKYMPERDYDGNEFLKSGTGFYEIAHLFTTPFYFMDYDLAHYCSVQIWALHQKNPSKAWKTYLNMCRIGGSQPFHELIKNAGLLSPFEENSVKVLLSDVEEWIETAGD